MSRSIRAVTAFAVAALAVPLWAAPAYAESGSEGPSSAAYFYSAGVSKPDPAPFAPPNLTAQADGVAPGNLAVASQANREDKASFLFFSLSNLEPGATITKATLTVPTVPNGNGNVSVNAAPEKVAACKIIGSGFSEEDGENLALAPERACGEFNAVATAGDGGAYVFDITGLAATWTELNDGVALTRNPAGTDNFQVVFSRDATLTYEFTPGAGDDALAGGGTTTSTDSGTTAFDAGDSGSAPIGGFDSGSASSGGSFDSGGGFGAVDSPLVGGELPAGPAPETADATGDEPVLAVQSASSSGGIETLTPTAAFWLGLVALAALLAFLSLIMGDPRTPAAAAATSRPSRLTQALQSRSRTPLAGSTS